MTPGSVAQIICFWVVPRRIANTPTCGALFNLQSLRAIARAATAGTGDDVLFEHIDTSQINGFRGQFFVPETDGVPAFHVFSPPFSKDLCRSGEACRSRRLRIAPRQTAVNKKFDKLSKLDRKTSGYNHISQRLCTRNTIAKRCKRTYNARNLSLDTGRREVYSEPRSRADSQQPNLDPVVNKRADTSVNRVRQRGQYQTYGEINVNVQLDAKEQIRGLVAEHLKMDPATISDDMDLATQRGADSLTILEVALKLEERFGIVIPNTEYAKFRTLTGIADAVERLIASRGE